MEDSSAQHHNGTSDHPEDIDKGVQCPTPAVRGPQKVSAFLRPLVDMTKEELIEICTNLEVALSLKDDEIDAINQHYEHLLETYYDTADMLALRNSELMFCQDHLTQAQDCLQQWKTEILQQQTPLPTKHHSVQSRASVVSDSVLLESRARSRATVIETPPNEENAKENLNNPKRVMRRMNQSCDSKTRITPVLHRRKSSKTREERVKPTPAPRHTSEERGQEQEQEESETEQPCGASCVDPDLLKDMDLGVTAPLRMSYMDDATQVDILKIEQRPTSSQSEHSDESDDTLLPDSNNSTLKGSYDWSEFEDRPRTDCGRPLTGERRMDTNERPPTRSGGRCRDVAASYSFEGSRAYPDYHQSLVGQPKSKPKTKIIFKEIKNEEESAPIQRQQTPHAKSRPKDNENMETDE